jgi:hypothetical protein
MNATIDIDDELYRRLRAEAEARGRNVTDLVLEAVEGVLTSARSSTPGKGRIHLPMIDSGQPDKLSIPDDIAFLLEAEEDRERHEASLR